MYENAKSVRSVFRKMLKKHGISILFNKFFIHL